MEGRSTKGHKQYKPETTTVAKITNQNRRASALITAASLSALVSLTQAASRDRDLLQNEPFPEEVNVPELIEYDVKHALRSFSYAVCVRQAGSDGKLFTVLKQTGLGWSIQTAPRGWAKNGELWVPEGTPVLIPVAITPKRSWEVRVPMYTRTEWENMHRSLHA